MSKCTVWVERRNFFLIQPNGTSTTSGLSRVNLAVVCWTSINSKTYCLRVWI